MERKNDVRSLMRRYGINASRIILVLFITAGVVLPAGAAPVLGAPLDEPSAPDVTARCELPIADTDHWTCEDVEDPLWGVDDMTDRYFRYKSDGTPCLAFGHDGLYYACYDEGTNTWDGVDAPIDADPLVGSHAALAFDDNDLPYISYYDATNGALKLAYEHAVTHDWVIDTLIDENNDDLTNCPWEGVLPASAGMEPEVDTNQPDPWIDALVSGNFWLDKIKPDVEENPPGAPASPDIEFFGVGKYTSIDIDSGGRLHISFFNEFEGWLQYYFTDFITSKCATVDDYQGMRTEFLGTGLWTSIATDGSIPNPTVHISYFNDQYDQLKYARSVGYKKFDVYELTPRAEPTQPYRNGPFSSIAINEDDDPVISFLRYTGRDPEYINGDLRIANVDNPEDPDFDTIDGSSDSVGGYTSISFEDDGDRRISHYNFTDGDLKYNSGTLRSTGNVGRFTSIDTYSTNVRGIAYLDDTQGELVVIQQVGGGDWEALGVNGYVAKFGNVGKHNSLVIREADDIPFISYYNETSDFLKYAFGTFKLPPPPPPPIYPPPIYNWTTSTVTDDYPAGTFTSIGISDLWVPGNGEPVIAYYRPWDDIEDEGEDLMFAYWDDFPPGWVIEEVDTYGDVGQYVDMAVDSNGVPHISYYDDSRGWLNYAYYDTVASSWMTATLDKQDNVDLGLFTSIALSPDDRPYITYYDKTNERIKYIWETPQGNWALIPQVLITDVGVMDGDETPVANMSLYYEDVDFDVEPPDIPDPDEIHLSYYDSTTDPAEVKDLKYYRGEVDPLNGSISQKQISTLKSGGDVGMYNDIVVNDIDTIDSSDVRKRSICYYDATNGDLEVAEWIDGSGWSTYIVDQVGDVGSYCSINLEKDDGDVTISYYDASRGALRFAHNPYEPGVPDVWEIFVPMMAK
jgi:hypothetical protein